jgi:prevent-host-death family protein
MKASIAVLRARLSQLLEAVQNGKELEIQRHNITIAKIVPIEKKKSNNTQLGLGIGTAVIVGDLTDELIEEGSWNLSVGKF